MTEQSKIPVPPQAPDSGKSLFERLGEGSFSPAPVPRNLARPVNRPVAPPVVERRIASFDPEPATQTAPIAAQTEQEQVAQERMRQPAAAPAAMPKPAVLPKLELAGEPRHVSRKLLVEQGLIDPDGPVTALLEEFRIVKRQVLKSARVANNPRARRILVCSPLPGEGKTFCAANLALAMASERDCEVVLVDADVAKPSLLSLFGLPKGPGLMDALANPDIAVEDCVIATDIDNLSVLPAGDRTHADSEYLASARTVQLLDRLTQGAPERVLVFDSPPALAASPAADLAAHVGQALVIARADKTGQSALEDALSLLSACPDIKLLLNDARFSPSGRKFGTYYGYGGEAE